ncbi:strawberry notch C-terminal domain-containing protein [Aerosakkonemataceae cyanobacterium BLCC-F50]|uniref:Strawberry notch C-terminal domain-containing protein n=1 Tax=Floridaenema flaviceps BLCC-F50 TaxID=3153642 RepID=A0ABV4Y1C2_9CYAN
MKEESALKLISELSDYFYAGNSFASIIEARKFAEQIGGEKIESGTVQAKYLDEIVESALTRAANRIVSDSNSDIEAFDRLINLYQRQPSLNVKTSTSVAQQAYSTPIPIAYLAATLAGIDETKTVYEPTGGHGSLLIKAAKNLAQVNELNPERAHDLIAQGFSVTQNDAITYTPTDEFDVVILNPPFGTIQDKNGQTKRFLIEAGAAVKPGQTWQTTQLDHVIALRSLTSMKTDGKAVLILGGKLGQNEKTRSNRYNTQMSRAFYQTLYSNYNVTKHISIDGNLYRKQGAGFPIDLIVIDGIGRSNRQLPASDTPKVYTSFAQLKELFNESAIESTNQPQQSINLVADTARGSQYPDRNLGGSSSENTINRESNSLFGTTETSGVWINNSGTDDNRKNGSLPKDANSIEHEIPQLDSPLFQEQGKPTDSFFLGESDHVGQRLPLGNDELRNENGISRNGSYFSTEITGEHLDAGFVELVNNGDELRFLNRNKGDKTMAEEIENNQEEPPLQVAYKPGSGGLSLNTLVPTNLSNATQRSLSRLTQKVRPQVERFYELRGISVPERFEAKDIIDTFVMEQLDIPDKETLYSRFSAEQIDAGALFISTVLEGKTFIQGDQTGIGKGRNAALAIDWAIKHGMTPIFITQSPELHSAMMSDLADIGRGNLRPFPTTGERIDTPNNGVIKLSNTNQKQLMNQFSQSRNLGNQYDFIVTTYSQLQNVKGNETSRHEFLRNIAPNALIIMDECHNAVGSRNPQTQSSRARFARELLNNSRGGLLLSATSMKDANYSLYAKTDMLLAVDGNVAALDALAARGGIPMMQMVSVGLASSGQYIRRERSYEGVEVGVTVAEIDLSTLDQIYSVMADIVRFDDIKQEGIKAQDKALKAEAKAVLNDDSVGMAGADSSNFTAIMHNLSSQLLLAAKAETSVQWAVKQRELGKKPVLSLYNTMGSAIDRYVEEKGLKPGDAIDISFGDLLKHYAERSREIRTKDAFGDQNKRRLTDEEIGSEGVLVWDKIMSEIDNIDFSSLPVSPIDYISNRLQKYGIKTGEVTGRDSQINYSENPPTYEVRSPKESSAQGRKEAVDRFNSGRIDAIILNSAGSTGISLHASEKFSDKSIRVMGILQADPKITGFMQMLGRIHRTGQVALPEFEFISTSAPAEVRPTAVLLKKLAALNANTTATRQSAFSLDNTVDFLNEYGDQIVAEILSENPRINEKLDYPLDYDADNYEPGDDARKVTGRAILLSIEEQKWFLDTLTERYSELVTQMEAIGESTLEAKSVDLDARTLARMEVKPADIPGDSPFTEAVYLEVIDAKTPVKPYTQLQCVNQVRSALELEPVADINEHDFYGVCKQGEETAANTKSELKAALEEYRTLAIKNKSEKRIEKINSALDNNYGHISKVLDTMPVGQTVRVLTGQNIFYGVVTKIWQTDRGADEIEGRISNPAAPSNWKVKLAIADTARELSVPMSKINQSSESSIWVEPAETDSFKVNIYEIFDQRQSKSREQRQIFTGNILRAYTMFNGSGRVINFTDNKGNVRQGILMPKGFDIQKSLEAEPVKMPTISDIKRFITSETNYLGHVKTEDGILKIQARGNQQGYMLSTPISKAAGGGYYLDKNLIEACGAEFTSIGDVMRVMVPEERIEQVLDYLISVQQHTLCAFEQREEARKMLGIELPTMEALEAGTFGSSGDFVPYVDETNYEQTKLDLEKLFTISKPELELNSAQLEPQNQPDINELDSPKPGEVSPQNPDAQTTDNSLETIQNSSLIETPPESLSKQVSESKTEEKSKQIGRRTKEFVRNATNPYIRAKLEGLAVSSIGFGTELFDTNQTAKLIEIFEQHADYRQNLDSRTALEGNLTNAVLDMHANWMSNKTARQVVLGLIEQVELAQVAYEKELYKDDALYGTPFWSMIQTMSKIDSVVDERTAEVSLDPRLQALPSEEVEVLLETLLANKLTTNTVQQLHQTAPDAAKLLFENAAAEAITSRHLATKSENYMILTSDDTTHQELINGLYDAYLTHLNLKSVSQEFIGKSVTETFPSSETITHQINIASPQQQKEAGAKKVATLLHKSGLATEIMKGEDFHLKVENSPYIPLVIERHENELYLTHYLEQGGDTFIDSEMVYRIGDDGSLKLKEVATQNPFIGGEARSHDRGFAQMFSSNLIAQGFAEATAKALNSMNKEAVEPTQSPESENTSNSSISSDSSTLNQPIDNEPNYFTSLNQLRLWYVQARDLGRDSSYLEQIKSLGEQMKACSKEAVQYPERSVSDFPINAETQTAMQADFDAYRQQTDYIFQATHTILQKLGKKQGAAQVFEGKYYRLEATNDTAKVVEKNRGEILIVDKNQIILTKVNSIDRQKFSQLCVKLTRNSTRETGQER